jgi:uncharacterized protein YecE (DUF72 family)
VTVHIGTSGWQYDHWRGDFYSAGLPKRLWFEHYAEVFDTVELNNSFYRQPKDAAWDKWHDMAPPGFRFAVKANRFITHIKRLKDVEDPVERFLKGAERLKSHLGPLLYQLPPTFDNDEENCRRLEAFLALLPKRHHHVIEFRHNSWHTDAVLALLRRHDVGFCCHDMKGLHPPVAVTSGTAYVRLHGRRYGGNYDPASLKKWAVHVHDMQRDADEVWVFFNNDLGGHAPRNALQLIELLSA